MGDNDQDPYGIHIQFNKKSLNKYNNDETAFLFVG